MTKKPTYPVTPLSPDITPEIARQIFAKNLQTAMHQKRMIPAELSRRSGIGRDNISKYLRAKILPKDPHLFAIAKVLGKRPEELLPARPSTRDDPPLDVHDIGGGNCWVRVNQAVPTKIAQKLLGLLSGLNGDPVDG